MSIKLIADSSCDMTPALKKLLDVETIPFIVDVEDKNFIDDENVNIPALLAAMKESKNPVSTACPSPESFAEKMRKAEESIIITISSKLSGCYNAAVIAKQMVLEEFPNKKIHIIDSESATAGETRIALLVRSLITAGENFESIVEKATEFAKNMRTRFVLEDLSNLVKNGRISKTAGIVGAVLNIRPILADNGEGEIVALEKVRGTQNAFKRLVEIIAESTKDSAAKSITLVLSYANCIDRANEVKKEILAKCHAIENVIMVQGSALSTAYMSDGGIVVAY